MNKKHWWFLNSGSVFTPASLLPVAWWDSRSSDMASDGSLWTDRIGGYNLTASGSAKPTYTANGKNGQPSFTFNGTTSVLTGPKIAAIQNKSGLTMWRVVKATIFDGGVVVSHGQSANLRSEINGIYSILANGANTYGLNPNHIDAGTYYIHVMIFDGTQSTNATKLVSWLNGPQVLTYPGGSIPTTTESNSGSLIYIGKYAGGAGFIGGEIFESGIVDRAINSAELTNLTGYLSSKYLIP